MLVVQFCKDKGLFHKKQLLYNDYLLGAYLLDVEDLSFMDNYVVYRNPVIYSQQCNFF